MTDEQPSPDAVLQRARQETQARRRGKLKIFFGYAAGVGKTFSMLEATRAQAAAGTSIVLGYVEPHARPDTLALMQGLEVLGPKEVPYRGITIREFDLDGALARRPAILVVDELAHTNAPGVRHAKRWQDVQELLEAGINVYTTLNVQHLESLNDIVAQISGIQVRETVPDTAFDQADSIELVDLPPEELLQRFTEGKIYVPHQAERAMERFFRLPNLVALRELALRRTADRVNVQVQSARQQAGATQLWATSERLLVCVGPSPTSARVIRVARRLASALRAGWIAAYVDTGAVLSAAARERLTRNLNMAEQLGAETITLAGQDVADELVRYAATRNVTKIVIGKTGQPFWKDLLGRSLVTGVLRHSGDADVYIIRGTQEGDLSSRPAGPLRRGRQIRYRHLAIAAGVTALCTGVAALMRWLFPHLSEVNQIMVYFLGVVFIAARYGRWPGVLAAVLSVLEFDFFFVQPFYTFRVTDTEYFITFGVMLVIAILISHLGYRIGAQAQMSRQRERHTQVLYHLSRRLASTAGVQQLVTEAETELGQSFASEVAIFLPSAAGRLQPALAAAASFSANERELAVAQWAFEHGQLAGSGTDTLPDAHALYVPLSGSTGPVGVLGLRPIELGRFKDPDQRQLLEALASQIALAIERDRLAEQAHRLLVQAQNAQPQDKTTSG
jgi:two-component system sensor histidine kinase KdpD